jgi:hypothetical protein
MFVWKDHHEIVHIMKEISEEENNDNVVTKHLNMNHNMNHIEVREGRPVPLPPLTPFYTGSCSKLEETRQKYFRSPLRFCYFSNVFPVQII